jgi:small-conductance mechanosensitive channel
VAAILARRLLARRIPSPLLLDVIARAVAIPVFLLGLYFVLLISDLTRLALTVLGGTGLVGLILGFAFRDIGENFLASLFLSVRSPFRTGDYISVDDTEGVVQNLNTRSTVLLTLDGKHVQIPNATVFKNKITNYSTNPHRRSQYAVGIANDASISQAQEVILAVLDEHAAVLPEPEPLVLVDELGKAGINLKVFYWFDSTVYSPIKIRSAILRLTRRALVESGIAIADASHEVTFPNGVPFIFQDDRPREAIAQTGRHSPLMDRTGETGERATRAEGDLVSEEDDVRSKAEWPQDGDENLLRERNRS